MPDRSQEWNALDDTVVSCRKCPRLVEWREQVAREKRRAFMDWDYWGKPVPAFGDRQGSVLVVGLAPAAHGANRTGRMFTGDSSGDFLYAALEKVGFANQGTSRRRGDGLELSNLFISAVCRCAPPANRPKAAEMDNCQPYLEKEIELLDPLQVIVVLGHIAFNRTLRLLRGQGYEIPRFKFTHGAVYDLGPELPWMVVSYHPSRQNTQTGRLTQGMFDWVWEQTNRLLKG
jgi:uracil-DNA glycosylase family 4